MLALREYFHNTGMFQNSLVTRKTSKHYLYIGERGSNTKN
ncbi:uncharacterized protein METZ01_LOCUS433304, partial [marine metagenome]